MPIWYQLVKGKPVLVENDNDPAYMEWWKNFENRRVAQTYITDPADGSRIHVATDFLSLDHNSIDNGPPILWETMIFGGVHDDEQWRYRSEAEALDGHEAAVKLVRDSLQEAVNE